MAALLPFILWPAVVVLVLAVGVVSRHYVSDALDHRRYAHALENITRLERELQIGVPVDSTELARAIMLTDRTYEPAEPSRRVYGHCDLCGKHVALNAGRCRGFPIHDVLCAKDAYAFANRSSPRPDARLAEMRAAGRDEGLMP